MNQQTETPQDQKPLTRDDVLRLIKEHGGQAHKVDLSGSNLEGTDLSELDLRGIRLTDARLFGANFRNSNLQGAKLDRTHLNTADMEGARLIQANMSGARLAEAKLSGAILEEANLEGVWLGGADLRGADLLNANLQKAHLSRAKLEGAFLSGSELAGAVSLEGIDWGEYTVAAETRKDFSWAQSIYRILRQLHRRAGLEDEAAKFYYREMECRRKALSWRREPLQRLWRTFLWSFGGYGERPFWILGWWVAVILVGTLLTYVLDLLFGAPARAQVLPLASTYPIGSQSLLPDAPHRLYYVLVSFTAVGYGGWVSEPTDPWKWLGAVLSLAGAIVIGIFVVYLTRVLIRQ